MNADWPALKLATSLQFTLRALLCSPHIPICSSLVQQRLCNITMSLATPTTHPSSRHPFTSQHPFTLSKPALRPNGTPSLRPNFHAPRSTTARRFSQSSRSLPAPAPAGCHLSCSRGPCSHCSRSHWLLAGRCPGWAASLIPARLASAGSRGREHGQGTPSEHAEKLL